MGEVIRLSERPEGRGRRDGDGPSVRARTSAEFFFDLGCPFTYLAAEQLERAFDEVIWTPTRAAVLPRADPEPQLRRAAEARAAEQRLPLVWPDGWPFDVTAAMRTAGCAADAGRAGPFVLAACRLAFCGGFDLGDPEILAEAAAAAGLPLEQCLRAARDVTRDDAADAAARRLLALGADRMPAVRIGRALHWGPAGIGDALAGARVGRAAQR